MAKISYHNSHNDWSEVHSGPLYWTIGVTSLPCNNINPDDPFYIGHYYSTNIVNVFVLHDFLNNTFVMFTMDAWIDEIVLWEFVFQIEECRSRISIWRRSKRYLYLPRYSGIHCPFIQCYGLWSRDFKNHNSDPDPRPILSYPQNHNPERNWKVKVAGNLQA